VHVHFTASATTDSWCIIFTAQFLLIELFLILAVLVCMSQDTLLPYSSASQIPYYFPWIHINHII